MESTGPDGQHLSIINKLQNEDRMGSFLDELVEGKIDFRGQQAVDFHSRIVLVISSFFSFCIGFALQDLRITFAFMALVVLALALVILPPWPMFNRYPVKWLPPKESKT